MGRRSDAWDDDAATIAMARGQRRGGGWLGWVLFILLLAAVVAFGWYIYLPISKSERDLAHRVVAADDAAKKQNAKLEDTEARLAELTSKQEALSGQLTQTVAEKEKIEAELKAVQDSLSEKLEPEIQAGNVHIVRRGNDLVVDLADQILFDSGKSDVIEKGQEVLGQVAPTLANLTDFSIQVAGHTDAARITSSETLEHFPTNWELSTARATNVVRTLEEQGKIPGSRLVAMGYSMYRPVATNDTAPGRKKNRRIELVLIRSKPATAATTPSASPP